MKTFYHLVANSLLAFIANFFVWFALTFWLYLETQSVLVTGIIGGSFVVVTSLAGIWLGAIVDHHRKKTAMLLSSIITLIFFSLAFLLYVSVPENSFQSVGNPVLWAMIALILIGVCAGNIRMIATPTLVTLLIPEGERDKANGMSGMVMGISSSGAGILSGPMLAYLGMEWIFSTAIVLTILCIVWLLFIPVDEKKIVHTAEKPKKVDLKGTIRVVGAINGLFALIFFTTFNNFLGGAFMALMDPYGLSLVPVQVWSLIWGVLSMGFIIGGLIIAKKGVGKNPLKTIFRVNIITWTTCILFVIQPNIWLLCAGILAWVICMPFIEASEQTVIQRVVPLERQGRVFGFAQSVEMSASPITAFLIGPIAQFFFIPFMTTGRGVELIGSWFGTGQGRGIALVFMVAGVVGLCVTILAMHSKSYRILSDSYRNASPAPVPAAA